LPPALHLLGQHGARAHLRHPLRGRARRAPVDRWRGGAALNAPRNYSDQEPPWARAVLRALRGEDRARRTLLLLVLPLRRLADQLPPALPAPERADAVQDG